MDALGDPPGTTVLRIEGRIDPADVARLCDRVRGLLEAGDGYLVVCDMSGLDSVDAAAIDALARMQLTALRLGYTIRVRHVGPELAELLDLAGLSDVVVRSAD